MGHPSYPRPTPVPYYTPPKNSVTTATAGPQVKTGEPGQGGFQVLSVRPRTGPTVTYVPVAGPGPRVPPATRPIPPGDKAGALPGTDKTRGLLVRPRRRKTTLLDE